MYVAQAASTRGPRLDLPELGVGQRDRRGQLVASEGHPLLEAILHIPSERVELLDVGVGDLQVLLGPEHADVRLGDRQLQVEGRAELLAPLGTDLRPAASMLRRIRPPV